MTSHPHNARYAKLRRQVGKVQFNILEVRDGLRQCRHSNIVCECQNFPLPVRCAKKIDEIFNIDLRLIKCNPELSLRTKIFLIFRVVWNVRNLSQGSAYRDYHITASCNGSRQRTRFFHRHKFRNIISHTQSCKVGPVDYREASGHKAFSFKIRSKRAGCYVFDVVANSSFCKGRLTSGDLSHARNSFR